MRPEFLAWIAVLAISIPNVVISQSLSVSPTNLNVVGTSQTTLTVKAGGNTQSVLQLRVLSWNEKDDPRRLKSTRAVAISPPMAKLKPRQELTVRIVRTSRQKIRGKECYRVLVDRLPGREQARQKVKLQVRHSIPLCFSS